MNLTASELDSQCPTLRKGKDGGPPPASFHSVADCPSPAELITCPFFSFYATWDVELQGVEARANGELACLYYFQELG